MNRWFVTHDERFGHDFFSSFVQHVVRLYKGEPISIALGYDEETDRFSGVTFYFGECTKKEFIRNIKIVSGLFYLFFSSFKKDKDLPEYLSFLNVAATNDSSFKSAGGRTALCVKEIFGNFAEEKYKLRPFDDMLNFRKTYILPGVKIIKNDSETVLAFMRGGFPVYLYDLGDSIFYPFLTAIQNAIWYRAPSDETASVIRSILKKKISYL